MSDNLLLEKQLCFRLYSLNKLMCRLYAPVLKELALTYPQYLAMLVLWQNSEGISVKDLGNRLDLDSGTLSPLLKRMEAQGLLARVRQPSDERVVIIKLTKKGMGLQQSAEHIPGKMFAVTGLTPDKLLNLNQELDQLIANISD
ncbi:MarR family winged helix-turn-helix transcriptional regulator [Colwellia psychrerythraea]|uniref:Transcriptional regulator, MarR family n=1 Tax=Colwellia psychrerythraea (strain 34H / ATCC BAA-681) TaxID=167879 RepID=Q483N1_COLP3|nr:MarR family transcriptional regulator [Colwellia psychrerythraea]AAZ27334.1 transcriptional regulator, MarR family [Colwellia psychrerythraea 34H]